MNLETPQGPDTGRSRWKIPAFLLAAAAGLGLAWYILMDAEQTPEETSASVRETAEMLEQDPKAADDAVDLAIKTISLSQGEGGLELWRLKAEWANLRRRDDMIIVEEPRLTYNMREEGKVLFVESHSGDINQKDQILRFIDKVSVTQDNKHMTGPLLVYNGNDKTMTFPQGCSFIDTGVTGSADSLVWHIDQQLIEGKGNIKVLLDRGQTSSPTTDSGTNGAFPAAIEEMP